MLVCAECGETHPIDEIELTFRRPDLVAALPPEERKSRVQENKDLCILDGQRFFVRALLPLPVISANTPYNIGLWVELPQQAFERIYELWDDEDQADEPPFATEIANAIPTTVDTMGLKANLILTGPRTRPNVFVTAPEHPLHVEQSVGITPHRVAKYNSVFEPKA